MPYWKVMLGGCGISLPPASGIDNAIGFYTTRIVKARDADQAGEVARHLELQVWRDGGEHAHGHLPTLTVEKTWPMSFFKGKFGPQPKGYTFFDNED